MSRISKRTGVPVTVLRQLNRKSEPLKAGAKLRIPGRAGATLVASTPAKPASGKARSSTRTAPATATATKHKVQSGDTLGALALRYGVSVAALSAANPQLKDPGRCGWDRC